VNKIGVSVPRAKSNWCATFQLKVRIVVAQTSCMVAHIFLEL